MSSNVLPIDDELGTGNIIFLDLFSNPHGWVRESHGTRLRTCHCVEAFRQAQLLNLQTRIQTIENSGSLQQSQLNEAQDCRNVILLLQRLIDHNNDLRLLVIAEKEEGWDRNTGFQAQIDLWMEIRWKHRGFESHCLRVGDGLMKDMRDITKDVIEKLYPSWRSNNEWTGQAASNDWPDLGSSEWEDNSGQDVGDSGGWEFS